MEHVIVVDVGTSSLKAMVYTRQGRLIAAASQKYDSRFGHHYDVEQDPQTWREALLHTLGETAKTIREQKLQVAALIVTSQRASVIPVEKHGAPLYDAVMWQDKRSVPQCEELLRRWSMEEIYHRTGLRANPYFSAPKMMWLRENRKDAYAAAHKLLGVQDFVVFLLTRAFVTDTSQACRTLLMNINTLQWDDELLEAAGIKRSLLPDIVPSGALVGKINSGMASAVGLPTKIPVYLGGGDQQCAALSLGILSEGDAQANTGTGAFMVAHAEKPHFHPQCKTLCSAAAAPGKWIVEAGIFTAGLLHKWFKDNFYSGMDDNDAYARLAEEIAGTPVGANGVLMLPHFEGSAAPYWNPQARGMFFNLTMATTRADMARAVIEGIALEIGHDIELIQSLGVPVRRVSLAGGLTGMEVFNQAQADVFNKETVRYGNSEASSLGALMSACVSLKYYRDYREAFTNIVTDEPRVYRPIKENVARYAVLMERKKRLYDALDDGGIYTLFADPLGE
ncbi:MAG: hypothetical protein LBR29_01475 [Methylobacteriaceae bacterium]|jgi:xylulokinase/glycerol kinase|nr:hypothetical protein [Methylobacteriaceae bacterium]